MKKPQITTGKWAKDKKAKSRIRAANDRQVAACGGHTSNVNAEQVEAENDANATAIAALPDLLEALEMAYKAMTATAWTMENNSDARNLLRKADQVQAALEKAGYTFD